jgi:Domain of unknown function (DUF4129)
VTPLLHVPIEIGRQAAAAAARAELAKSVYAEKRPPLLMVALQWVVEHIELLLARAADAAPGGWLGLALLAVISALVVALVLWHSGPVRRTAKAEGAIFVGGTRSSAEYRQAADRAAAAGAWAEAVRERFRALVRAMEEREVLDGRPGRTADEAAIDGAGAFPSLATDLTRAAATFDDVVYGGLAAGPVDDARLRELDRAVAGAPVFLGATLHAGAGAGWRRLS